MAISKYYPHIISLNSTDYNGVQRYTMNGNTERSIIHTDGNVDPTHAALMSAEPALSVSSYNVAGLLAAVGFDGVAITNLTAFFKKGADCGTRAGTLAHVKGVATAGCAIMRPLRAQQGQRTMAEVEFFLKSSDGLTDPWTMTYLQTLSGTAAEVSHFTMGPVWVTPSGGSRTAITAKSWEVDPGIEVTPDMADGHTYPTYVGIDKRTPTGRISTPDIAHVEDIPNSGVIGSVELFLRKLSEGNSSGRVPDITAEHVKITIADALITADTSDVDTDSDGGAEIMIDATYDGTNAVIVLAFNQAIA